MVKEPEWRKCDECDVPYIIVAVHNPRREVYAILPLSRAPEGVRGNFELSDREEEVSDADGDFYGPRPVALYGQGDYVPHAPSHFLDEIHADERPRQRLHNFRLAMEDS